VSPRARGRANDELTCAKLERLRARRDVCPDDRFPLPRCERRTKTREMRIVGAFEKALHRLGLRELLSSVALSHRGR